MLVNLGEIIGINHNLRSAVKIGWFVNVFIIFSLDKSNFIRLNKFEAFCFLKNSITVSQWTILYFVAGRGRLWLTSKIYYLILYNI